MLFRSMIKAFNDHMSSAGSGIGAAERQMIKKSLGLSEKFSNWRSYLIEVMGDDEIEPKIKQKKIKNKLLTSQNKREEGSRGHQRMQMLLLIHRELIMLQMGLKLRIVVLLKLSQVPRPKLLRIPKPRHKTQSKQKEA